MALDTFVRLLIGVILTLLIIGSFEVIIPLLLTPIGPLLSLFLVIASIHYVYVIGSLIYAQYQYGDDE